MHSLLIASLIVAPVPEAVKFGNWVVACDNGLYCEAAGLQPEDAPVEDLWTIHVTRRPDASAPPTVEIGNTFEERSGPLRLKIDGRITAFQISRVSHPFALLTALAAAHKAEIVNARSKPVGTLSVAGASAATRWMDERQKRAGTVTAILARGRLPAVSVPPPPALPRIKQPPASEAPARKLRFADIRAIQALASCQSDMAEAATFRLDANHTLGIVGCIMGAYQGAQLIVVLDEGAKWRPALIEQPYAPDKRYSEPYDAFLLREAEYVEDKRLLSMHAKGRGVGDCGESATWAWDGQMFRLASFQALDLCRGAPPGTWLSRWRTANDPVVKED